MAEAYEEPTAQVDDDVLPDGVEEESTGIEVFDQLDEGNLVGKLDDLQVGRQGVYAEAKRLFDAADASMDEWRRKYEKAMKLATLDPGTAKKTFPFEDASTVMMPFILEAMLDFHSRTVPELVWAKDVVAMETYGTQTEEKQNRARRTSDFMNYQISEDIEDWRPEQDKMLLALPCVGTSYRRSYYNGDRQECRSDLYLGDKVIFDMNYKTFKKAPDYFVEEEYTRNEVLGFIRGAAEWDMAETELPMAKDHPDPFEFIRAWTWIDLDDDGLTEPYEVILYPETEKVVAVYPAYDEEGITTNDEGQIVEAKMVDEFTQYRFLPDPDGGPMGLGWGILLCDAFDAINTAMRQMMDAGTLANLAGSSGIIDAQMSGGSGRGNRVQTGPIEVRMGELTPVTTGGKPLGQSVVQFPYQGPNTAMFQLLEYMVTQIRDMTNSALNMDTNSQEAAIMYLTRLQQGLKVPNSIVMRVYHCAKEEFGKIALLNFKHYSNRKYNLVIDAPEEADMRADFNPEDCDIRTAADPSQGSDVERQQRANLILQEAKEQPQPIMNLREAYLQWLEALNYPDPEGIAPEPSGEPSPMEQAMIANLQREADIEERDMVLKETKQQMEALDQMMEGMRKGAEFNLDLDFKEAQIAERYANAMYKLWEMGMAGDDPVDTVENIERRLIDKNVAPPPPQPLPSPEPQGAPQEGAPA